MGWFQDRAAQERNGQANTANDAAASGTPGLTPPAGVPPGSTQVGYGDNTRSAWLGPDGNTYWVYNGQVGAVTTAAENAQTAQRNASGANGGGGQAQLTSAPLNPFRAATDSLGVTTPDPSSSPQFQQLQQAANDFGGYYKQDRANVADSRTQDLDTIARLRAAEEGKTPSAAEALMRKAIDQNANQALGLAATLGGSNPGMALRAGLQAQEAAGTKSAADIAALRANEMAGARQLLAEQTSKGRAVDTSGASSTGNTFANIVGAPYAAKNAADASNQALWGTVLSGVAKGVAASDISLKRDIQPAPAMADAFLGRVAAPTANDYRSIENASPAAADAFLSTLHPQSFQYKAPDGLNKKPGTRMGVMAQDLPPHDVKTGPDGKKWISADVINDVLAGMGRLHERTSAIEQAQQQPMISSDAVHDYLASLGIQP